MDDRRPVRLDINDPKDVQGLVNTGLAWRSGPATLRIIFDHIEAGRVTRNPAKETPEIASYFDGAGPVEPTIADEEPPLA